MARPPNRAILLARLVGTQRRAEGFAARLPASAKLELASINLEARNLRDFLLLAPFDQVLSGFEARLMALAKRLDDLEDSFRPR